MPSFIRKATFPGFIGAVLAFAACTSSDSSPSTGAPVADAAVSDAPPAPDPAAASRLAGAIANCSAGGLSAAVEALARAGIETRDEVSGAPISGVAVPNLIRVLDSAGLRAQSLTLTRPSLDDVFLRQTGRSLREEPAA